VLLLCFELLPGFKTGDFPRHRAYRPLPMIKAIAQEIDFLASPKTPMGGPQEPKI
jgi:hypothetical protein